MTEKKTKPEIREPAVSRKISLSTTTVKPRGFYAKVLKEAEAIDFETAEGTEGLDDEIALLRVKIKELVSRDPDNIELIMQAANMLARMVKIKYSMSKEQKKGLGEAIKKVITDIGVPLGVAIINKKL
jgi:hypothetical protein